MVNYTYIFGVAATYVYMVAIDDPCVFPSVIIRFLNSIWSLSTTTSAVNLPIDSILFF